MVTPHQAGNNNAMTSYALPSRSLRGLRPWITAIKHHSTREPQSALLQPVKACTSVCASNTACTRASLTQRLNLVNRIKASLLCTHFMAATMDECTIEHFPRAVLQNDVLLRYLRPVDIAHLSCASSTLRAIAQDDSLWKSVCEKLYNHATRVQNWLPSGNNTICNDGITLYRQLFPLLKQHAEFIGVWHQAADTAPRGALYSFRWSPSGVDIVQLVPAKRYSTRITHSRLCTLSPCYPRYQAEVIDGCKCVLRDFGVSRHNSFTSTAAEAAASVAAGFASNSWTSNSSDAAAGSSPPGSWGAELLRFMQSSVQRPRSGRKNRRSGGSDGLPAPPVLHHFTRVQGPIRQPARQHPHQLAGLWKGLYGPHGCELVSLRYDFTQKSARVVATKLTGDPNVPAGEVTWTAAAAPLSTPWPAEELELLEQRPQLVATAAATAAHLAEAEADDAAAGVIAALLQHGALPPEQQQQLQQQDGQQQGQGISGLQNHQQQAAADIAAWAAAMQARRVVGIYPGEGHVANHGFRDPRWVSGRLWVYEDGSCGFVFELRTGQQVLHHLVDLERLDADL